MTKSCSPMGMSANAVSCLLLSLWRRRTLRNVTKKTVSSLRAALRLLVFAIVTGLLAAACYYPTEPGAANKCTSGCYIRSASVCCPSGYLNYAGAGYGCFATHQACLNASGRCWYETSCIP